MHHPITIGVGNTIHYGTATTDHSQSSYGQPVIVIADTDQFTGGIDHPAHLPSGVYGPHDLPNGAVIGDGTINATPHWMFFGEVRDALIRAGYRCQES